MAAADYKAAAVLAAQKYGVPVNMFLMQIEQESSWNPNAKNPKPGSTSGGLGGFIDQTAKEFGINKYDPYQALDAAAKYDAQLFKKHGDWQTVLEKYGTLAGASDKVYGKFNAALSADLGGAAVEGEPSLISKISKSAKDTWNKSMFGLAADTYANLSGGEASGTWDFQKWARMGTFIVLGVVVVAIAVLQNPTVKKAVTKGVA